MDNSQPSGHQFDQWLARLLSRVTGVPEARFLDRYGFDELGLDSLSINEFNLQLSKFIDGVPRSLLFDCRHLGDLSDYLGREHTDALSAAVEQREHTAPTPEAPTGSDGWPALSARTFGPGTALARPKTATTPASTEPIAIVGLAGRYPEADDVATFWRNLAAGRNSIREIPEDRWPLDGFFEAAENAGRRGKSYCKWGAFLDDVSRFDADFFGIAPREAVTMDPQERIFLECAWQALEDAGLALYASRDGDDGAEGYPVSVHVGVTTQSYPLLGPALWQRGEAVFPVSLQWSIANRVSYLLNLSGPSMPVDTACSASLTALHLACSGLRNGEAKMALVGGVNLYLHPSKFVWLSQQRMLTATGQCHTFSDDADGFVPGEGVGAVVLKPLSDAQRDGNHIYGLIAATSVNHGGRSNGYSVPTPKAHARLIRDALQRGGVDARTISYMEAHGTGTRLGDPVEIDGLKMAFRPKRDVEQRQSRCALASTKTNIGHLESAAGIAGLTRILLQLKHREVAPSLNLNALNPNIDMHGSPFRVVTAREPWQGAPEAGGRLRAAISSFGAGGANAHAIIDEAPYEAASFDPAVAWPQVYLLSARSSEALRARIEDLLAALAHDATMASRLAALAWTLQLAREPMSERVAIVADTLPALISGLRHTLTGQPSADVVRGHVERGDRAPADIAGTAHELAEQWCRGRVVAWTRLWPQTGPGLLPLPPYRFGGDHHWVRLPDDSEAAAPLAWAKLEAARADTPNSPDDLPPLSVDASATYLKDHVIGTRALLSGTTMIELVRATWQRQHAAVPVFQNLNFMRPCAPLGRHPLEVAFAADGDTTWRFELRSPASATQAAMCHLRGSIRAADGALHGEPPVSMEPLAADHDPYADFAQSGLAYGPSFRPIRRMQTDGERVLADIELPMGAPRFDGEFDWHPGILDAFFQATLGFSDQHEATRVPYSIGQLQVVGDLRSARRLTVVRLSADAKVARYSATLADAHGRPVATMRDFVLLPLSTGSAGAAQMHWLTPRWQPFAAPAQMPAAPRLLGATEAGLRSPLMLALCHAAGGEAVLAEQLHADDAPRHVLMLCGAPDSTQSLLASLYDVAKVLIVAASKGAVRWQLAYRQGQDGADPCLPLMGFARTLARECPMLTLDIVGYHPASESAPATLAHALLAELGSTRRAPAALRLDRELNREVLSFAPWPPPQNGTPMLSAQRSYLITGGAGGLGRLFARHLATSAPGCRIVLCARREPDDDLQICMNEIEAAGSIALYVRADLATDAGCTQLAQTLLSLPDRPLAGIVHAAGTLRDAFILRKEPATVAPVFAAKLGSLQRLDQALAGHSLDWMVLFSSLAAAMGNIGQSDYAVANAALDEFAGWRNRLARAGHRRGVCISINWPLWDHGGMQVDAVTRQRHIQQGIATLDNADGIAAFDTALAAALDGAAPDQLFPLQASESVLSALTSVALGPTPSDRPHDRDAASATELREWLRALVADTLGQPRERVTDTRSFNALGIDSIMVTEMNDALKARFPEVSSTLFFEVETLAELQDRLPAPAAPRHAHPGAIAVEAAQSATADDATDGLLRHLCALLAQVTGRPVSKVTPDGAFSALGLDSVMVIELHEQLDPGIPGLSRTLFFECDTAAAVARRIADEYPEAVARRFGGRAAPPPSLPAPALPIATPTSALEPPTAEPASNDIAIIGVAGRYPGGEDLDAFWASLRGGLDLVREVPAERWPGGRARARGDKSAGYARWGSFLQDVDQFDPLFFGISPREAERTDPQERLFLETAWHAIENAGYTPAALQSTDDEGVARQVGIYVGVMYGEYQYLGVEAMARGESGLSQSSYASIANRVSYTLDLNGPSMAVDTMCSSSLTAIHLACDALRAGSCQLAIAGGVNLSIHPYKYRTLEQLKFASTDGRCRSFGDGGDGYVPGEGVGAVLLKPLNAALADGDHIHAIVRGSAINHGGRTNGYTVPNPNAQGRLVAAAFKRSGVSPAQVNYIEAHGTGTPLGDPIEIRGLSMAFGEAPAHACALGSLKSNLGHLEAAAGIAALTKVLLQLQHRELVPTLHSAPPNPNIDFSTTPFHVQTALGPWHALRDSNGQEQPRIAGISSFGAGGSNAHLVIQQAPERPPVDPHATQAWQTYVLSARSEALLRAQAGQLHRALAITPAAPRDLARTLQFGRTHHPFRLAVVARSVAALREALARWLADTPSGDVLVGHAEDADATVRMLAPDTLNDQAHCADAARRWVGGNGQWHDSAAFRRVPLPGTVWQRRRCWLDPASANAAPSTPSPTTVETPAPRPTPAQVLKLYQQGRVSHAEAVSALHLLQASAAA